MYGHSLQHPRSTDYRHRTRHLQITLMLLPSPPHRNPQGLDFGPDGTLYSSEQGPKTDDEVNILKRGGNYGWPHVASLKDNQAYQFARWAEATTPCSQLQFSDLAIHASVPREPESVFPKPMVAPLATMFTVPSNFNFHDPALSPDGKTIYIATDPGGLAESRSGGTTQRMLDRGAIVAFTYVGESTGAVAEEPRQVSEASRAMAPVPAVAGVTPQFSVAQVAAGKTAYHANCAVCHGSTLTNGTFGTPLAGEYFKTTWFGKTVRALHERAQKTMPPASPGSLPGETYRNVIAYILEVNGFQAGDTPLPSSAEGLEKMAIK